VPLKYKAYANVEKPYEDRVQDLVKRAAASAAAQAEGLGGPFCFFGDGIKPFDNDHPTELFNRDKANDLFAKATTIKDDVCGAAGDVVVALRQIEYLACLERAYRRRHQSPLRAAAQAVSAEQGLGRPGGVFARIHLDELRVLVKATAARKDQ
jgi:hypothetical protein